MRVRLKKYYAEEGFIEAGTNIKKTWKIINELCSNSKKQTTNKINQIKTSEGSTLENDMEIAQEFNNYFSTIGSKLAEEIQNTDYIFQEEESVVVLYLCTQQMWKKYIKL